jgi:hypothetical protein
LTVVGALGSPRRAVVDARGMVLPRDAGWELGWWIGADDRWHVPAREASVRQSLVDAVPVVQTAMRVPGGNALHRVYGTVGDGDPIVVEIENDSAAPFVVAFVVRGARAIAVDGPLVRVDGSFGLIAPRAPSRWATSINGPTEVAVCSGAARTGPFPPLRDRAGRLEAAFLHPVAHRTTLRIALLHGGTNPIDPRGLPSATQAAHGWRAQLERGLRVALPDQRLVDAVDAARADVLLEVADPRPSGITAAALEDWGFDAEAAAVWAHLSGRERRRARQRHPEPSAWVKVLNAMATGGATLLMALRGFLVHEAETALTILPELPDGWRGAPIEVHDAPTRRGSVSYAVRWHGDRPALLWEVPEAVTLCAPGLDSSWSTTEARGELLLS